MSESEGITYSRESVVTALVERVRYDDPIEEVLTDMFHTQILKQKENAAISALTSSTEKNDTTSRLIAQSDLTAARTVQIQEEMKLEKKRLNKTYIETEEKVKSLFGKQINNTDELKAVIVEVHQKDPGTRLL